jgi:hypothetical protein
LITFYAQIKHPKLRIKKVNEGPKMEKNAAELKFCCLFKKNDQD